MTVVEPTGEHTRHAAPDSDDILAADAGADSDGADGAGEEGYTRHTLAALVSPGALALSAFTLAASGLVALLAPLALIPTFVGDEQTPVGPAKSLAYMGIGIAIVAIALALWSLFRPESGPEWPRTVAGAAAVVALMVIFQYSVVLLMAANAAPVESFVQ